MSIHPFLYLFLEAHRSKECSLKLKLAMYWGQCSQGRHESRGDGISLPTSLPTNDSKGRGISSSSYTLRVSIENDCKKRRKFRCRTRVKTRVIALQKRWGNTETVTTKREDFQENIQKEEGGMNESWKHLLKDTERLKRRVFLRKSTKLTMREALFFRCFFLVKNSECMKIIGFLKSHTNVGSRARRINRSDDVKEK